MRKADVLAILAALIQIDHSVAYTAMSGEWPNLGNTELLKRADGLLLAAENKAGTDA